MLLLLVKTSLLLECSHFFVCSPKTKMDYTEPVHYTLQDSYSCLSTAKILKKYCSHEDVCDQILPGNNKVKDKNF